MTINSFADWSTSAASNVDVGGYEIGEGSQSRHWNNALRELMAQLKVRGNSVDTTLATGFASVETYGALGDGATDDRSAFAAADAAGVTIIRLREGKTYRIGASMTISAHIEFAGGKISPDSGVTVTLAGGYTAFGAQQAFTGSGTVSITNPQTISPQHWGARNKGLSDDYSGFIACLNAGSGHTVDGLGWTFRIDSEMAPSVIPAALRNATLDCSNIPDGAGTDTLLLFAGSQGTATTLGANASKGDRTLTVASTVGFSADGYAWLYSDDEYDAGQSLTLGQIVRIEEVTDATTLTLFEAIHYDFATADNAAVAPLNLGRSCTVENVSITGGGAGTQEGLRFDKCLSPRVRDCTFDLIDHCGLVFQRCVDVVAANNRLTRARAASTAYGIQIGNGCMGWKLIGNHTAESRHGITIGDNDGVNLLGLIDGNTIEDAESAGIDSHSAGDLVTITNNVIRCTGDGATTEDGIFVEGGRAVIADNFVVGARRHGIAYIPAIDTGYATVTITGNRIVDGGGGTSSDRGIFIQNATAGVTITSAIVANNHIDGAYDIGINVHASSGSVAKVAITGNVVANATATQCLLLQAATGFTIDGVTITGNSLNTAGNQVVYLLGADADSVLDVVVEGNHLIGGSQAIRATNANALVVGKNAYDGNTKRYLIATCTDLNLDRSGLPPTAVTDAATYTVLPDDAELIIDRAAGSCTLTLPAVTVEPGRILPVRTIQAQTVVSASSNVVPLAGGSAGTAICAGAAGAWARLVGGASNYLITAA